jgi:hypothetical protein
MVDVGQRNENNREKKVFKCANQTFFAVICSSLKEHNSEENTFMGCQNPKTGKSVKCCQEVRFLLLIIQ